MWLQIRRVGLICTFVALGALIVAEGWQLASFAVDARRVISGNPEERQRIGGGTDSQVVARLSQWRTTSGVRAAAAELLAVDPQLEKNDNRKLLDLTGALAETPTGGRLWLAYAEQVLRSGYGVSHAQGAIRMSQIVERRRAASMFQRALVVVSAWERMPNDLRQAAIGELALMRRNMGGRERAQMAELAATKSPKVRAEIREMLVPRLGEFVWVAKAMGF